jgi:diguanylate cyclase (GGDEF)-like protein
LYTKENLEKYDFFKDVNMTYALDSLTGVLSRSNILGFAKNLIDKKIPFMMGILDIDNFKLVNDNYGHHVGDECLKSIATGLADFVGEDGLVGRFGGDEFVIIHFKDTEYQPVHDYISRLYNEGNVIRRKLMIDNVSFLVTATIGCASFPKDSSTYQDLFLKIDKALYRGKTKGRNCFIIYVESKHRHIEVHRKEEATLPNIFSRISEIANDSKLSTEKKIKNILNHITYALHISEAVYLKTDKTSITGGEGYKCNIDETCIDIFENLTKENTIFMPNGLYNFLENEKTANFIKNKKILTFIVSKVKIDNKLAGFLILFESEVTRIWQEKDVALLLHLNTVIELLYKREKKD